MPRIHFTFTLPGITVIPFTFGFFRTLLRLHITVKLKSKVEVITSSYNPTYIRILVVGVSLVTGITYLHLPQLTTHCRPPRRTRTIAAAIRILSTMASDDDNPVASASAITAAAQEDVLALMETTGTQQEALPPLLELFRDTEHFSTYFDNDGKPRWRCGWCNVDFAGHNATKALHHIVRVKGKGIRVCDAQLPAPHYKRYFQLYEKKMGAKSTKAGKCKGMFV